jgi:hypothetical protein
METVGYGDVRPNITLEMSIVCLLELVAGISFADVIGFIG